MLIVYGLVIDSEHPVLEGIGEANPILRWAGGKRRLVPYLAKMLPPRWNTYVEPMAGSAALFFYLAPKKAVLADINPELMNFYHVLSNNTVSLIEKLTSLRASRACYYEMRSRKPRSALGRATRFAYLNRLCWNGLHRVNQKGHFNVPMGDRLPKRLWNVSELQNAARLLRNATLVSADFKETLSRLGKRDFAFIDPPYPRGAKDQWFNRYCKYFFTLEDHQRLGEVAEELDRKGTLAMILLAFHPRILDCYPSSFKRRNVRSKSLISGKPSSRRVIREVILTNYDSSSQ